MLDSLISLLAPHNCVVCGSEGSLLCLWCRPDALEPVPERCYHCKVVTQDSAVCTKCRRLSPLRHVWVTTLYKDTAKELVRRLKFSRAKVAARLIAELLNDSVPYLPGYTVVTYVPTATSRVRQRGYDQARLIAREFASLRDLQCVPLLIRHGQARQVGSDRKHRINQAAGNYSVIDSGRVQKKQILLIDDILTTGATVESAARVLKKAGAKTINAAIFAQKQ